MHLYRRDWREPRWKERFDIHYIRERDLAGKRGKYVNITRIRYRYPGGWNFDAEGLAVHPRTGELFVVTKTRASPSYIYKMDPRFPERPPTRAIEIDLAELFKPPWTVKWATWPQPSR